MTSFFDYQFLSVNFSRETRSSKVVIENDKNFNPLAFALELEKFCDWLTNKTEIYSVVFENRHDDFELMPKSTLKEINEKQLLDYVKRIQRISFGQLVLPQTIVWNLRGEIDQMAFEIMSASDIQILSWNASVKFDSLIKGYTSAVSVALHTNNAQTSSILKNYVMTAKSVSANELVTHMFATHLCQGSKSHEVVNSICKMSPIARIQFKRSTNDWAIAKIDELMLQALNFAMATIAIGDWKNYAYDLDFHNPREITKVLKNIPTKEDQRLKQVV